LYNEKIAENINKISEQEDHLTTVKELLDAGKISQEQYNRELAESNKLTAEYSKELTGFKQKMEDVGSVVMLLQGHFPTLTTLQNRVSIP
jgi:uncharacterized coiled-coil DUF342 family protein